MCKDNDVHNSNSIVSLKNFQFYSGWKYGNYIVKGIIIAICLPFVCCLTTKG